MSTDKAIKIILEEAEFQKEMYSDTQDHESALDFHEACKKLIGEYYHLKKMLKNKEA